MASADQQAQVTTGAATDVNSVIRFDIKNILPGQPVEYVVHNEPSHFASCDTSTEVLSARV